MVYDFYIPTLLIMFDQFQKRVIWKLLNMMATDQVNIVCQIQRRMSQVASHF